MSAVLSLISLLVFIAAGMLCSLLPAVRRSALVGWFSSAALYLLLFFMGFRISSVTAADQIVNIGVMSVVFAIAAAAGTAAVLYLYYAICGSVFQEQLLLPVRMPDMKKKSQILRPDKHSGGFRLSNLKESAQTSCCCCRRLYFRNFDQYSGIYG